MFFKQKQETPREITDAEKRAIVVEYLETIAKPYKDSEMTPEQMIEFELKVMRRLEEDPFTR